MTLVGNRNFGRFMMAINLLIWAYVGWQVATTPEYAEAAAMALITMQVWPTIRDQWRDELRRARSR